MYTITVVNSSGEYTIHNPYDEQLKTVDPVLTLELNKSGTLTFSISPSNENRTQILPMASEINVYRDGVLYWIGRPIQVEENLDLMHSVTCEGILGYLLDTQVPPFNFMEGNSIKGTECVKTFLTRLINRHNAELSSSWEDQRKKFAIGDVTIYDSNDNIARSSEDYATTLETINEKLLETHGGYLRVRYSGSTRYIDYIDAFGNAKQPISFGENLLDLTTHIKTDEIATNVIPLGAQKEDSDTRITLAGYSPSASIKTRIAEFTHGGALRTLGSNSSFAGFTGIYDKAGEDAHGRVYVVQTWDDVTTQQNLALKAAEYIGTISVLGKTIDLSAVDLAQIDVDYDSFNIGQMATVVSIPHELNAEYQITQMSIDLFNPANSTLVLGGEMRTFTFDNTKKQAEIITELSTGISDAVQNATALLSGGLGGYLIIRQDQSGQPYEILIMNQATEDAATNCVRINKNGLGFGQKASGQSAASWVYRNAWTIDGNLIADFITTGTLNANLIKAGTLQDANGNTKLNMSNGTLTMKKGSINLGSGKFTVNDEGFLKALSGTIGGMSLSSNQLYKTFKASGKTCEVALQAASKLSEDVLYSLVGSNSAAAISANGHLYSAPVNGSGNFTGVWLLTSGSEAAIGNDNGNGCFVSCKNSGLTIVTGRSTTSHSGNLYISGAGAAYYANEGSSSRKIKHDIKPLENEDLLAEHLYDVEVVQFKYNDDYLSDDDPNRGKDLVGFIVEDLNEVYPAAVSSEEEDSKEWTWSAIRIIPPMLKLIQDQKKEIDSLKNKMEDMRARMDKLEQMIMKGEEDGEC